MVFELVEFGNFDIRLDSVIDINGVPVVFPGELLFMLTDKG